ncbi:MAG: DUF4191 domain-containing protein [Bifidobacteriaceae bacterium]|jgi:hypothetical protein|nr:DUF4191 domain-containing protein [Bifidobacteriaceae bacterium]
MASDPSRGSKPARTKSGTQPPGKSGAPAPDQPPAPTKSQAKRAARAEARAAKRAAKRGGKPAKTRWYKQIWQVFQMTRKVEPLIWLWLLLVFLGVIAIAVAIGLFAWKGHAVYMGALGTPLGLLAAMYLLMNRAERAAYQNIEGKEGASSAALGQIRRGWTFHEEPVAIDPKTRAMVFRGVGRAGVVLVAEGGPPTRLTRLIDAEKRKVARVAPDIPVVVMTVGNEPGQVPLRKLSRKIQRQRARLSRAEVAVVQNRLKAIGGLKAPIPKGVDPLRARPDRKALRGR